MQRGCLSAEAFTRRRLFTYAAAHSPVLAVQAVIYFCGLKGMMPGRLVNPYCAKVSFIMSHLSYVGKVEAAIKPKCMQCMIFNGTREGRHVRLCRDALALLQD